MNRRAFMRGVALLGSALGLRLPKAHARVFCNDELGAFAPVAQPSDSMYIGASDVEWTDDDGKTWHKLNVGPNGLLP